ncbi:hypothetical protein AAFF_G00132480 [Aldrovandia affinis]|uniref:Uncharacterized protein n=1 Tax=Aldrovandia affinis TaxID=143900 RepID=A0AAD7RQL2_9TELE|nr:hypothetical protein AAFF_G00132480 [Aldrovandia affinis]
MLVTVGPGSRSTGRGDPVTLERTGSRAGPRGGVEPPQPCAAGEVDKVTDGKRSAHFTSRDPAHAGSRPFVSNRWKWG